MAFSQGFEYFTKDASIAGGRIFVAGFDFFAPIYQIAALIRGGKIIF